MLQFPAFGLGSKCSIWFHFFLNLWGVPSSRNSNPAAGTFLIVSKEGRLVVTNSSMIPVAGTGQFWPWTICTGMGTSHLKQAKKQNKKKTCVTSHHCRKASKFRLWFPNISHILYMPRKLRDAYRSIGRRCSNKALSRQHIVVGISDWQF